MDTKIAIFKGQKVRKTIYKNEWWFSVIDVIGVLTGTQRPRKYWNDLKKKIKKEGYNELSDFIGQLSYYHLMGISIGIGDKIKLDNVVTL